MYGKARCTTSQEGVLSVICGDGREELLLVSLFPCCLVICECLNKTKIEKIYGTKTEKADMAPAVSSLTFRQTIECRFTLKLVHDIIITYSQMHHANKYSQHTSIIWPVWLNGWVFIYELSGCGFEPCCCQLTFRYGTYFE